jgi:GNAT superfamily N-acetyltransferase
MQINTETLTTKGIKFSLMENNQEVARAYLYLMHNDLHPEAFGMLEDVYVAENQRGKGLGTQLVQQAIKTAQEQGCYKLIATSRTSRTKVHQLYERLGFQKKGLEFRIDF